MIEKKRKIERERGKDRDVIKERERQGKEGKTKRVRKVKIENVLRRKKVERERKSIPK